LYYCEGSQNYTDVVVHINEVLRDGDYCVSIAMDGKSVSWQRGVQSICFTNNILKSILKDAYSLLSHHAVAYDDVVYEMKVKKVLPKNKQFWGAPQMMRIKWECTGTFSIIKRDYEINFVVGDNNKQRNRQCNSVCIIKVKKTKEGAAIEAEVETGKISLFGAFSQSSHRSSSNPPSPPPRCKSGGNRHEVDDEATGRHYWASVCTISCR